MIAQCASLQGRLHKTYGIPNQDAAHVFHVKGATAAVLCDGVSLKSDLTFSSSEIASRFCVEETTRYLREHIHRHTTDEEMFKIVQNLFDHVKNALEKELRRRKIPAADCQTTMIAAVYRKGRFWAGIAGDGGILAHRCDGSISAMITEIKTSSQVHPLGSASEWKFFSSKNDSPIPVNRILIATDGVFDTLCYWNGKRLRCEVPSLRLFYSISGVREKYRQKWLEKLLQTVSSNDDLSCALIEDPHYFERRKTQAPSQAR